LVVFPRIAVGAVLPAIVCAAWLGELVPSLAPSIPTLRLMLVAFPFLVVGAIELYARSGEGRNQAVIAVTVLGLMVNVGLNVVLLSTVGLVGAGWALVGSEVVQVIVLWAVAREHERALLRGVLCEILLCGGLLLVVAVSLNAGIVPLAVVAAVTLVGGLLVTSRRPKTLGGLR
jgi:O-antigen/teichoic acid export membrane protein